MKKETLARKANNKVHGGERRYRKRFNEERNSKAVKLFHEEEQVFMAMGKCKKSSTHYRLDLTPLIRFLHKNVGKDATKVYRAAKARFWTNGRMLETTKHFQERWDYFTSGAKTVCVHQNSYWGGLFIDENNLLQKVLPIATVGVKPTEDEWIMSVYLHDSNGGVLDCFPTIYKSETYSYNGKKIKFPK